MNRRQVLDIAALCAIAAGAGLWRATRVEVSPSAPADALPEAAAGTGGPSILFIGNSFVFTNDLPGTLVKVAQSLGQSLTVSSYAPGGYTFEQHSRDANTRRRIGERSWDFVVLQEQSQRPAFDESQVAEEVIPPALALDAMIHSAHPASRTVFFETWGRRDGDASNCKEVPAICTYQGMQKQLSRTYADLARRTGALLAPVGRAWQRARASHPEIELYAADGIHPSREGTYLAACVFYATVAGTSPVGASRLGLSAATAGALQTIASAAGLTDEP